MQQSRTEAKTVYTCHTIRSFHTALEMYRLDVGEYPRALDNLIKNPGREHWNGPYITGDTLPRDAWGNPYRYEIKDSHPVILSSGPNGAFGTQDDIRCR